MGRPAIRLLLAALGLLLIVAAVWILLDPRRSPPSSVSESDPGRPQGESAVLEDRAPPARDERLPVELEGVGSAMSEVAPEETSEGTTSADDLRGLVVTETGEPIAGAAVAISRNTARDFPSVSGDTERWSTPVHEIATDASGRFAVRLPRGVPHEVVASHAGFVPTPLKNCYAGMDVTLGLTRGGTISGRIVYEESGLPVPGARVRVLREGDVGELFRGVADEQGEYRTPPVHACAVYVDVDSERCAARWSKVQIQPGEDVRCDVSLRRGARVSGTVRDSASGAPIAGAEVSDSWTFRRAVTTGVTGAFVLDGFPRAGRDFLSARAPGYARTQELVPPAPEGDPVQVDIDLDPGRRMVGRLVTKSGSPVAGGLLVAVMTSEANLECLRDTSAPDGRFEIVDMRRRARYLLLIQRDGFASAVYQVPSSEDPQGVTDLGDVSLSEASSLEGMVVDDVDGSPVPDMLVELWGSNEDRERLVERAGEVRTAIGIRGDRWRPGILWSDGWVDRRARSTDGAGRFAFSHLSAGEYRINVHSPSGTDELSVNLRVPLAAGERREGLRIVVPLRATLSGRVIGLDGRPVDGAHVMLSRSDEVREQPSMSRANEDGSFMIDAVHGKTYHLVVLPPYGRKLSDVEQTAIGAACMFDLVAPVENLEVRMQPADAISGIVRDASGLPVAGASVEALDPVVGRLNWGSTDHEGKFKLLVPPRPGVNVTVSSGARSSTLENLPSSSSQLVIELPDKP